MGYAAGEQLPEVVGVPASERDNVRRTTGVCNTSGCAMPLACAIAGMTSSLRVAFAEDDEAGEIQLRVRADRLADLAGLGGVIRAGDLGTRGVLRCRVETEVPDLPGGMRVSTLAEWLERTVWARPVRVTSAGVG